jgi:transposase
MNKTSRKMIGRKNEEGTKMNKSRRRGRNKVNDERKKKGKN